MKRLGRWLFNLAVVVSLLIWVACLALQFRVSHSSDSISVGRKGISFYAETSASGILIQWDENETESRPLSWRSVPIERIPHVLPLPQYETTAGILVERGETGSGTIAGNLIAGNESFFWQVFTRWWAVQVYPLVMPTLWIAAFTYRHRLHRNRRVRGLCKQCSYDLRATRERCPECGAIPSALKEVAP